MVLSETRSRAPRAGTEDWEYSKDKLSIRWILQTFENVFARQHLMKQRARHNDGQTGWSYLDIIRALKDNSTLPVSAYQVSANIRC